MKESANEKRKGTREGDAKTYDESPMRFDVALQQYVPDLAALRKEKKAQQRQGRQQQ